MFKRDERSDAQCPYKASVFVCVLTQALLATHEMMVGSSYASIADLGGDEELSKQNALEDGNTAVNKAMELFSKVYKNCQYFCKVKPFLKLS